jgi:hypothetical protein
VTPDVYVDPQDQVTEVELALFMLSYDRPADIDATGYRQRSKNWIAEIVRLEGFMDFSAHWNALNTSPNTLVLIRLASTEVAIKALTDPAVTNMLEDMRSHGCRNISAYAFKKSEVVPEPIIR